MSRSKLTKSQACQARRLAAQGKTSRQIAADLNLPYQPVCNAISGRTFAWLKNPPPIKITQRRRPKAIYTCQNPNCSQQFPSGHGRMCRACYTYYYRHGRHRNPETITKGPRIHIPKAEITALHQRYLRGQALADLVSGKPYSDETLRRRFYELNLPTPETCAGRHQQLTAAQVRQARKLAYQEDIPINEIAAELDVNYTTLYSAVKGHTWRSVDNLPAEAKPGMTPCKSCGLLSLQTTCRFCRAERTKKEVIT